jgi:hypothetical protein
VHLGDVVLDQRGDERLLAGKVLVQRADADACRERDAIGAGAVIAFVDEHAGGRLDDRVDRGLGASLAGATAGRRGRNGAHGETSLVTKVLARSASALTGTDRLLRMCVDSGLADFRSEAEQIFEFVLSATND